MGCWCEYLPTHFQSKFPWLWDDSIIACSMLHAPGDIQFRMFTIWIMCAMCILFLVILRHCNRLSRYSLFNRVCTIFYSFFTIQRIIDALQMPFLQPVSLNIEWCSQVINMVFTALKKRRKIGNQLWSKSVCVSLELTIKCCSVFSIQSIFMTGTFLLNVSTDTVTYFVLPFPIANKNVWFLCWNRSISICNELNLIE